MPIDRPLLTGFRESGSPSSLTTAGTARNVPLNGGTLTYSDTSASYSDGNGQVVWAVQQDAFAGTPLLQVSVTGAWLQVQLSALSVAVTPGIIVKRSVGVAKIALSGALYGGTSVPADFTMQITRTVITNDQGDVFELIGVQFSSTFLNLSSSGSDEVLSGVPHPVTLAALSIPLAGQGSIELGVSSPMGTAIPGSITVAGQGLGSAVLLGAAPVAIKQLNIASAPPGSSSLFRKPPAFRSRLTPTPDAATFAVALPGASTVLGTLTKTADLYGDVEIEMGADADGTARAAFGFSGSPAEQAQYHLQFSDTLRTDAGPVLALDLASAMQVVSAEPDGMRNELLAVADPKGALIQAGGIAFQLGQTNSLNAYFDFGIPAGGTARCVLPLAGFAPPLDGAVFISSLTQTEGLSILGVGVAPGPDNTNWVSLGTLAAGAPRVGIQSLSFDMLRPADLLSLHFEFVGAALESRDGALAIGPVAGAGANRLLVTLPPQHVVERDYRRPGDSTDEPFDPAPIPVRAAGPSMLAFSIPAAPFRIEFTSDALLDWSALPAAPPPLAFRLPQVLAPANLSPLETAIELPYRLFLSPNELSGWSHDGPFETSDGAWNPLWNTRLGIRKVAASDPNTFFVDERDTPENASFRTLRPVFSADFVPVPAPPDFTLPPRPSGADPFVTAVSAGDRYDIMDRAAFLANKIQIPEPLLVAKLIMSALGGWLDGQVNWTDEVDPDALQAWRHVAAQGRDHYVRLVQRGYLYPFGHRASRVSISERQFSGDAGNSAYLIKREFVVVTERVRDYTFLQSQSVRAGRDLPLREIEILTLVTPPTTVGPTTLLPFTMRGRDYDTSEDPLGRIVSITAGAIFVRNDATAADLDAVKQAYESNSARTATVHGSKVALAPQNNPGDTTFTVQAFTFKGGDSSTDAVRASAGLFPGGIPNFYPSVESAVVHLPAVQQLANIQNNVASGAEIKYLDQYLNNGFDPSTESFASLTSTVGVSFENDSANGVGSPSMDISGLSRKYGTVAGDIGKLTAGTFDPAAFFKTGLDGAKILGAFPIAPLVQSVLNDANIPVLKLDTSDPSKLVARFHWEPQLTDGLALGPISLVFNTPQSAKTPDNFNPHWPGANIFTTLTMDTSITTPLQQPGSPAEPDAAVTGTLKNFQLNFLGMIVLSFDELTFKAEKGRKPDITIQLNDIIGVTLGPALGLLGRLADALSGLLGDGPSIDISPSEVKAGYSLALPNVGLGVFSLENIRLNSELVIPLTNKPLGLTFSFADKTHPFVVTVDLIGGGGYFQIEADAEQGLLELTFSIQAGASISIDLGVASGSVSIMIGVLLQLGTEGNAITGFVRADGELSVLRLISLHVTFYLGLTYDLDRSIIFGEASVTVEVSVLFFDQSVTFSMRKEFKVPSPLRSLSSAARARLVPDADLPGRPPFSTILTEADWQTFTAAFA